MQTHTDHKTSSDRTYGESDPGIRGLVNAFERAARDKDLEKLLALYSPEHVAFDVVPPFSRQGQEAARQSFREWFDMYSGPIDFSFDDIRIEAEGTLAVVYALAHVKGKLNGKTSDGWTRSTMVLRKADGHWQIVHDHASWPFDMKTMQPVMVPERAKH